MEVSALIANISHFAQMLYRVYAMFRIFILLKIWQKIFSNGKIKFLNFYLKFSKKFEFLPIVNRKIFKNS